MAWDIEYTDEFETWWINELDNAGRAPYRVLYAFDPRRTAILLLGGTKKGDNRWYEVNVPFAEKLYTIHLEQLMEEGLIDGKEVS